MGGALYLIDSFVYDILGVAWGGRSVFGFAALTRLLSLDTSL